MQPELCYAVCVASAKCGKNKYGNYLGCNRPYFEYLRRGLYIAEGEKLMFFIVEQVKMNLFIVEK